MAFSRCRSLKLSGCLDVCETFQIQSIYYYSMQCLKTAKIVYHNAPFFFNIKLKGKELYNALTCCLTTSTAGKFKEDPILFQKFLFLSHFKMPANINSLLPFHVLQKVSSSIQQHNTVEVLLVAFPKKSASCHTGRKCLY